MNAAEGARPRRRILVAMDASPESLAGLRRAASLAAELQGELAGLFVEDINLLRLSELPGHDIGLASGTGRQTNRADMERQMRLRAEAARRELERLALAHRLPWTFEVRRSRLDQALREAAEAADLVCSALSRQPARPLAPRPRPQAAYAQAAPAAAAVRPVLALYEGGEGGARVLELAVRAAGSNQAPLRVLVPARAGAAGDRAVAQVVEHLRGAGATGEVERLPSGERAVLAAVAGARGRSLFLDAGGPAVRADRLSRLLTAAGCEVLLVSGR